MSDPMWTPPFRADERGSHVFDAKGGMVAQARGWGGLVGHGHGAYEERCGRPPLEPYEAEAVIIARAAAMANALNRAPDAEAEIARLRILLAANLGFVPGSAEAALDELGGMGAAMGLAEQFAAMKGEMK